MEGATGSDGTVDRMRAHFAAARRLRGGLRQYPDAEGLAACARFHIGEVRRLSGSICGGAGSEGQALARVAR